MSDRAKQADIGDATLDDVARWSADPGLAAVFASSGGAPLVLDADGGRVLYAPEGAARLHHAVADAEGRVRASLRLADQVRSIARPGGGPRLVRIRFDGRGIARPTACLVARVVGNSGDEALLLAAAEPLPAGRSAPPAPAPAPTVSAEAPQSSAVAVASPTSSGRIVWRSDAAGTLVHLSGLEGALAEQLVGTSWHALGGSTVIEGADVLAALDARQTFRALPLRLRPAGSGQEIEIDLSGAPSARPPRPFAGFAGFGVVRATRSLEDDLAATPIDAPLAEPESVSSGPVAASEDSPRPSGEVGERDDTVQEPLADHQDAEPPANAPIGGSEPTTMGVEQSEADLGPAADRTADPDLPDARPSTGTESGSPRGTDLSIHEHAAFREIARALGARFAGDDDTAPAPPPPGDTGHRGAVMAFPVSAAQSAGSAIDAAIVSALDRLPAGVLVHREAGILYVNRRFLEIAGHQDRAAMERAGVLRQLLDRMPASREGLAPDAPVSIATAGGTLVPLLVEHTKVDWDGGPAELLLVRAAAQADEVREQMARSLLEERRAARDQDALDLLDHIEEGVAALDETGRVLALNESARARLAGDAREIVGGTLADLFTPESGPAVAESLREARERGISQPRETMPRASDRAEPLRLRVARLTTAKTARFCVTLREPNPGTPTDQRQLAVDRLRRADFLTRVSDEIRTPLGGILSHAEAMLSETLGPLGSERYREYLTEIHRSGEKVLGVVDDLVDLARIEAGRAELTFTEVALNEVVSGCIAQMQPQAARDRIVVRTSLSPDLRPLVADARLMRQATLNVLANAIRLTEAGGQVIVSTTTAERGEIAFRVRDTGIGMTEDEIERVLSPFGRGDPAPGSAGSGLGLMLTKALVEANHGSLRITSRKNEGTLVEMLFSPQQALSA